MKKESSPRSNAVPDTLPVIRFIYDYERCEDIQQLEFVMERINTNQYQLTSVTQDSEDIFTVFFRRCAVG